MPKQVLTASLFLILLVVSNGNASAHVLPTQPIGAPVAVPKDCQSDDVGDLEDCIKSLEKKVKDLQSKERSLQNEIDSLNDQINLTRLKIQTAIRNISQREQELDQLSVDIEGLQVKIEKLGEKVNFQSLLLSERVRNRYKSEMSSPLVFIFDSDTGSLLRRAEYLTVIGEQDSKLIKQLKETKKSYQIQKTSLEEKKAKVEEIKRKIEEEKANLEVFNYSLANQKSQKDSLLTQTKGDERTYQDLLANAKAELDAINGVVAGINFKNGEKVDEGDVIAVMGNSGYPNCSTGAHLHFEVRKDGSVVNAEKYLKPTSVYVYDYTNGYKTIGSGKWSWPMRAPQVTQRYGTTPWSWRYVGNRHTGVDMTASNTYIYAPDDGRIVRGSAGCYGSSMNYAAIDHGDGVVSYYFHIR